MTSETYNELVEELNFYDESVGIRQTTIFDEEVLRDILTDFNYIPLGYSKIDLERVFKFKDENEVYVIQEDGDNLKVFKVAEVLGDLLKVIKMKSNKDNCIFLEKFLDDKGVIYQVVINNIEFGNKLLYQGDRESEAVEVYNKNENLI